MIGALPIRVAVPNKAPCGAFDLSVGLGDTSGASDLIPSDPSPCRCTALAERPMIRGLMAVLFQTHPKAHTDEN